MQEISKLKSLLNFREQVNSLIVAFEYKIKNINFQEAIDQMALIKQHQQKLDQLKAENKHLRQIESQRENIQVF